MFKARWSKRWPPGKGEWHSLIVSSSWEMTWLGCPECGKLISGVSQSEIVKCSRCSFKEKVEMEGWEDVQRKLRKMAGG